MDNSIEPKILKDFFSGFVRIHVLYHTTTRPFYGQELKEKLEEHGYNISYGTLYPLLNNLFSNGYLDREEKNVGGKIRKYYRITDKGKIILSQARMKLKELIREIFENTN